MAYNAPTLILLLLAAPITSSLGLGSSSSSISMRQGVLSRLRHVQATKGQAEHETDGEWIFHKPGEVDRATIVEGLTPAYLSAMVYGMETAARAGDALPPCFFPNASYPLRDPVCKKLTQYLGSPEAYYGGAYGYSAKLEGQPVLVFAGTQDFGDLFADIKGGFSKSLELGPDKKPFSAGGGFIDQYDEIRNGAGFNAKDFAKLHCKKANHKPILVTGHSLGGALANLAAVDLRLRGCRIRLHTFGAPRTFHTGYGLHGLYYWWNEVAGANEVQEMLDAKDFTATRWVNEGDPVPTVPFTLASFKHIASSAISIHNTWGVKEHRTFSYETQNYAPWTSVIVFIYHKMIGGFGGKMGTFSYEARMEEGVRWWDEHS